MFSRENLRTFFTFSPETGSRSGTRLVSILIRDNTHLSRPTMGDLEGQNRGFMEPSETVLGYVRDSISENTKRAYRSDLKHFLDWGGSIPATEVMLAD